MKILLSIIFNALILFALAYFLDENPAMWIEKWIIVEWWITTYLIWWVILWVINVTVRPILKILTLPLFFLWFISLIINWIVLWLLTPILNWLFGQSWFSYTIDWTLNFIIAIAIFSFLNMIYSLLFKK